MHRTRTLIATVVAALFVLASPAVAQEEYPPQENGAAITVAGGDSTVTPGEGVTASGTTTLADGTELELVFNSTPVVIGSGTVAGGAFSISGSVPADATPGAHTITVEPAGSDTVIASLAVQVADAQADPLSPPVTATSDGDLPATGSDSTIPMGVFAIGIIAVGAVAVLVARRIRSTTGPAA